MTTRRRAIAGLALGSMFLVLLACDHGSPTEPDGAVGFQTVLAATVAGSPLSLQGRETIRDRATWQAVWGELQGRNPPQPLPEVDFNREMVVLVVGPGCCGDAEILSIARRGGELVVSALTQSSTNTLCVLEDFSVHAVRLSRFDVPVRFDLRTGQKVC